MSVCEGKWREWGTALWQWKGMRGKKEWRRGDANSLLLQSYFDHCALKMHNMGVSSRAERSHAPLWRGQDFHLKELSLRQFTWNLQTLEHRLFIWQVCKTRLMHLVSRDQSLYQIWAKSNNPRLSYWRTFSGVRGMNCTKFGEDIGPSSMLAKFLLDFRYLAPFWNADGSKGNGSKI